MGNTVRGTSTTVTSFSSSGTPSSGGSSTSSKTVDSSNQPGWGAVKGETPAATTYGGSQGIYRDDKGNLITREQAMKLGRIDAPDTFAKQAAKIGLNASTSQIEQRYGMEDIAKRQRQEGYFSDIEIQKARKLLESETAQFAGRTQEQKDAVRQALYEQVVYREPKVRPAEVYRPDTRQETTKAILGERIRGDVVAGLSFNKLFPQQKPKTQTTNTRSIAQRGSIADKYYKLQDAEIVNKAGFIKNFGAILSSTDIFAKAAEVEARGVAHKIGIKSDYFESVDELIKMVADRHRNKPNILNVALESPITAGIPVGAAFKAIPFIGRKAMLAAASKLSVVSEKGAKVLLFGEKLIEPGLMIGGVGYIASDIAKSKNVYEGIGKTASLVATFPGASFGYNKAGTIISAIQTAKLKTVPPPISESVLTGKETFPTTRAGSFDKFKLEFEKSKSELAGYHATSTAFPKEGIIVKGMKEAELRPKDVPGLYVSPVKKGASPVFLRLPGETPSKISAELKNIFTSSPLNPQINLITNIAKIERIWGGKNVQKSRAFLYSKSPKKGVAYIEPKIEMGGFKGEAQAVLPAGTILGAVESSARTKIKGQYVPVVTRPIIASTEAQIITNLKTNLELKSNTINRIFKLRDYKSSTPTSRPVSSLSALVSSLKSSRTNISSQLRSTIRSTIRSTTKQSSKIEVSPRKVSSPIYTPIRKPSTPISLTQLKSRLVASYIVRPSARPTPSMVQKSARKISSYITSKPTYKIPKTPILTPKSFNAQLNKYIKDRKKRIYVWDINNPVPTLKSLTG